VIVPGETGLLFETGNIPDLTAKTVLAARHDQLRSTIGRNARERISGHGIENALAAYSAILEDVVGHAR
jgi:glycosyltransferase involved in cell wall biosynthesis